MCLGYLEDNFLVVKDIMYDYLLENRDSFADLGEEEDIIRIATNIKRKHFAAEYICLRIAADCFQRTIHLYRDHFSNSTPTETFVSDHNTNDQCPLKILFVGNFRYGHFQAIIP